VVSVVLTSLLEVDDVNGPLARADLGEPVRNGVAGDARGALRRLGQRKASGQARTERGRVCAAGAVRRAAVVPSDRDLDVVPPVEEVVDRRTMPPGDDHRRRSESMYPFRQLGLSNSLLLGKNG
jgi:hypothetical protein